jgi:hypothetical protein
MISEMRISQGKVVPKLVANTVSYGDVWQVGDHSLCCGVHERNAVLVVWFLEGISTAKPERKSTNIPRTFFMPTATNIWHTW